MEFSQYSELFLSESREHIASMNHLLLALEENPSAREPVEGIFRAVHTIKGMSATMGFRTVSDLAHELENLLDLIRNGLRSADGELVDLLFSSADALEKLVELAVSERDGEFDVGDILVRLRWAAGSFADPDDATVPRLVLHAVERPAQEAVAAAADSGGLRVQAVVDAAAPLPGVRAFLLLRRARELGTVRDVEPPEIEIESDGFEGTVRFTLEGELEAAALREALLEVGELERVTVEAPAGRVAVPALGASGMAEALLPGGSVPEAGRAEDVDDASRVRSIRVDLRRLDALMNEVGELVILRDRLQRIVAGSGSAELEEAVDQTARLVSELQDEIMRVRMVPVAQVFDRFPRLVRDAARALGKKVNLVIEGKEIEFDRSMLDEIGEPLVHLLRNSLDHGIELPEERSALGKVAAGTLRLSAARERSRAVIRVEDDGRGIRRERVLARAVSQGMLTTEAARDLGDEEVFRMLTLAGFSTADKVSDVSGRGVGLDVVATKVRALGGTLEIASTEGEGTAFTLRLPLTLAIVHSLLVTVDEDTYALPLAHVAETVEVSPEEVRTAGGRAVIVVREEVVPLLSLREVLQVPRRAEPSARASVVILELGEQRLGIEVDGLLGQQEIVVKGFDATVDTLRIFSGATILSDGRPALILDAGSLAHGGTRSETAVVG
jgi:two-component system, chemotaxis family, sensor kinase CheA